MRLAIAAAAVLAFASAASAATIRRVPQDHPSILAAEAACVDGDTIKIAKGHYFENVILDVPNVTIVGSGVVWDGNVAGTEGDCLLLLTTGTVVKGITFRNGTIQVNCDSGSATVKKCIFLDSNSHGIYVDSGTNVVITGCKFQGSGSDAVNSWANNTTVSRCTLRAISQNGISCVGNGFRAQGNTLTFLGQQDGIYGSGTNPVASKNKLFGAADNGIYLTGATAVATGNTVVKTDTSWGIYASGAGPWVEKNKVTDNKGGIYADGGGATVLGNKVSDVHGGFSGFEVGGDLMTVIGNSAALGSDDSWGFWFRDASTAGGGIMQKNRAADFMDAGVYFENTHNGTVNDIWVSRCGSYDSAGIYVTGDDTEYVRMIVSDCENRGMHLYAGADGNTFTSCAVKNCSGDGYRVMGPDNTFVNCTAANCGEGLDNRATGTAVTGGKYRGDRFDITNSGTFVDMNLAGVDFTSGGSAQASQVD
jgi:hypothetical protein